ncbi:uncharacterized [Tachysurus ichikawai]
MTIFTRRGKKKNVMTTFILPSWPEQAHGSSWRTSLSCRGPSKGPISWLSLYNCPECGVLGAVNAAAGKENGELRLLLHNSQKTSNEKIGISPSA